MSRLLHAEFGRLRRNRLFLIGSLVMAVCAFWIVVSSYRFQMKYGYEMMFNTQFFVYMNIIGVILSVFTGMFVGTEYSDGTIRNKLIIGHKRSSVYLTEFFVTALAGILMNLTYMLVACAVGIPLFGKIHISAPTFALYMVDGLLVTIVYAAIFTLVSMLSGNKATAAVLCMLLLLGMAIVGVYNQGLLSQPEMIEQARMVDGEMVIETVKNHRYISGVKREICQFIADVLPVTQGSMIESLEAVHPKLMALYSVVWIIAATGAGLFFFERKNIK